jgi:hypothetical protein
MNREGLKRRLEEEGVSPSSYDLRGGLPSEAYCLEEQLARRAVAVVEGGGISG